MVQATINVFIAENKASSIIPCIRGVGGTTRPLPRDGSAEELRGDPTVGPHPKARTIGREQRKRSQR